MGGHGHEGVSTAANTFVKRREPGEPGSIPEVLGMFAAEVRFYREIAPVVGVRVPACHRAEINPDGSTEIVLEDLSSWDPGADPVEAVRMLKDLHERWAGQAAERWPWLRPVGAAADLIGALYDKVWREMPARLDVSAPVRNLGDHLVGRVATLAVPAGALTLVHGDAATRNFRTGHDGPALLDWEDVSAAPGIGDVAMLLVSSTPPDRWDEVLAAYGTSVGLREALVDGVVQELFSLDDDAEGSDEAIGRAARLDEAARRLGS